jgi:hypothetical protein
MLQNILSLKVADIAIDVYSDVEFTKFNDHNFYKDFLLQPGQAPACILEHKISPPPDMGFDGTSFEAQGVWRLSRSGPKNVLWLGLPEKGEKPENVAVFSSDYSSGQMYQSSVFELFRRFIDQFLVINLLSRKDGFLLHSSGVVWDGKGICFIGPSGSGKSTILNMFKDEIPHNCLLNDDRLALRRYGDKWRVFGTPWYGESQVSSSNDAPVSTLFFIRHAKTNYVRRLGAADILRTLMVESLVPIWDEEATSRVLATFQTLIETVPAYELGFVPDKSAIELIKETVTRNQ